MVRLRSRVVLAAFAFTVTLFLTLSSRSLWTDEAFSAWLACHHTFSGLLTSLRDGNSSDLQMPLYYCYLFVWVKIFGSTEYALRAANMPFAVLFVGALFYTSVRVFKRPFAWLVPALMPFVWWYLSEARAYFPMFACATACLSALLVQVHERGRARATPWLFFVCFVAGACLHMLFLLAAAPFLVLILHSKIKDPQLSLKAWKKPFLCFLPIVLTLALYYGYTFARGAEYLYPHPDRYRTLYVLYELLGLSGIGPAHGDLWSHSFVAAVARYALPLGFALGLMAVSIGLLFFQKLPRNLQVLRNALLLALLVGTIEVLLAAAVLHSQFYLRHLAALVAFLPFLYLSCLQPHSPGKPMSFRFAYASMIALALVWVASDVRMMFSPENWKEDMRGAAATAAQFSRQADARIIWDADPTAAAYYGIFVSGAVPCYPLPYACGEAWSRATWQPRTTGIEGARWSSEEVSDWLKSVPGGKAFVLVLPSYRTDIKDPWRTALSSFVVREQQTVHGFDVLLGVTNMP